MTGAASTAAKAGARPAAGTDANADPDGAVIVARGIAKTYDTLPPVHALRDVGLTVRAGERVAVLGRSGSGKSTLLNILGLLDEPTRGSYRMLGVETARATHRQRDHWRAQSVGFVFQDSHVLGHRTVTENIHLKLAAARVPRFERPSAVVDVLERVGLEHRAHALGRLLSGGEKQRLAIARSIVVRPSILLADEPTGNLDRTNTAIVLGIFDAAASDGVAVVVITHDPAIGEWADRAVMLRDGEIVPYDGSP